jgi:hypothetical protein|tara:strand:- start:790 stop:1266 length:477 start_codon:yes stop_codon:yes gene_type:complete
MIDTLDVIRNIKKIYASDNVINSLVSMEKVMDDVNMYAYKNWTKGELVDGPYESKYDISATFMWEQAQMPDPEAGKRLLTLGARVEYKKDVRLTPKRIKSYADFRPGTRKAKLEEHPIWLVKVTIPKTVVEDFNAETTKTKTVSGLQVDQSTQDASEL